MPKARVGVASRRERIAPLLVRELPSALPGALALACGRHRTESVFRE